MGSLQVRSEILAEKMEAVSSFKSSDNIHLITQRYVPEGSHLDQKSPF
jgi:hypothetical protein